MRRLILARVVQGLFTLLILSVIVFMSVRLSGDPALLLLPPEATTPDYEQLRKNLGLDKPLVVQYGNFLKDAIRGDFGMSITTRRPARDVLLERIPATLQLAAAGMGLAVAGGETLGGLFSAP